MRIATPIGNLMRTTFTLYNNKGGVSKTTTTFNLAAYLCKYLGKRGLIIDADPQCNITELFLAGDESFRQSTSEDLPGDSIYDALRPRLEGDAARVDARRIKLVENKRYAGLWLLRGDITFGALAEGYFSAAVEQAITSNVNQKNTYLAFRRLVRDLAQLHDFDFIAFDLGPSTGAISRLALLACTVYFIPITADRFSALAVRSLPHVLQEWFRHDRLVLGTLEPYGLEADYAVPAFCGAISQQFQVHRGRMKVAFERWNTKIKQQLLQSFVNASDIPVSEKLGNDPIIAEIENLGPVAPVAQLLGKAIFDITQDDTRFASSSGQMFYGAVFDPWKVKISRYREEMAVLAKAL